MTNSNVLNATNMMTLAIDGISLVWVELVMFIVAVLIYTLFYGGLQTNTKKESSAALDAKPETKETHRAVLSAWRSNPVKDPKMLPRVIGSMRQLQMDVVSITAELRTALKDNADLRTTAVVNDLVSHLCNARELDVLDAVLEMLPSLNVTPDNESYSVLLQAHLRLQNFHEVQSLASRLRSAGVAFSPLMNAIELRAALGAGNVDDAITGFKANGGDLNSKELAAFLRLLVKDNRLATWTELKLPIITTEILNLVLGELASEKNKSACVALASAADEWGVAKTAHTYALLIKAETDDAHILFEKIVATGDLPRAVALQVLSTCSGRSDVALAGKVFAEMKRRSALSNAIMTAVVKVYVECEAFEAACDLYETEMKNGDVQIDAPLMNLIASCATKVGKPELASSLSSTGASAHIAMIRAKSRENDLEGALNAFENLRKSGVQVTTLAYNALLDACVQCGKLNTALRHFAEMKSNGNIDVVSYNTLMKAYLHAWQIEKARALLVEMAESGIEANKVTYNEMLHAFVSVKDRKGMWALIEEMGSKNMRPNSVTCSIILKSLTGHSHPRDIARTMDLVEGIDDMDEILFSSVIEACVRVGRLDLLSAKLQQYASKGGLAALTAPTYGSMIKAYGRARDLERVRELWAEMRRRNVKPTSITLGCMIDALVKNDQPEDAFSLVQEVKEDAACKDILNTVIYSTLLKGFALSRNTDRVEAVYREMVDMSIACNTVTFNTMIDAMVRTGKMDRAAQLFEQMKETGVHPDVITHSTLVKGYCLSGDIEKGFKVLRDMIASGKQEPDEILYNSLLDGCAKQHRVDDALALLEDMYKQNVAPSNFTLSILVKLLGRSRRLNEAFKMVEETCRRFDFAANIHVYTCLIQACIQNRQLARALKLHDSMVLEAGVKPDAKTYSVLVRGCLSSGSMEKAATVVRAAHGLTTDGAMVTAKDAPGIEHRALEEAMHALSSSPNAEQLAVPLLSELRAMGVHVEQGVYKTASLTAINRAGRNNANPVQAALKRRQNRNGFEAPPGLRK